MTRRVLLLVLVWASVTAATDHCNHAKCSCYKVKSGDWPYKIATTLGVTYEELQAVNPTMNPTALQPGDLLSVPSNTCVPAPPPPPTPPTPPQPGPCTSVDWSNANKFKGENPLTGYVGGNRITGWSWTSPKWQIYDLVVVGFVQYWTANSGSCGPADLWAGLPGYPTFKSGACGDWGDKLKIPGGQCSNLMNCKTVGDQGGQGLKKWQNAGQRRALISMGGAIADATFTNEEQGEVLARVIWEMYLGGSDSRYDDVRPFGRDVILDGVDLDIEQRAGANTPTPKGWGRFVTKMRELMDNDNRKDYLIAAAPINPTYASGYNQEQYGSFNFPLCHSGNSNNAVDTNALAAVSPSNSVYGHLDKVDYVFPQFYNTPSQNLCGGQSGSACAVPAGQCYKYCFRHWAAIVKHYGKGKCRLQLGLPYGLAGASNGFVPGNRIEDLTKGLLQAISAEERQLFAGYMGWEWWADAQTTYVQQLVQASANLQSAGLMPSAGTFTPRPKASGASPCGGESSDTCNADCGSAQCGSNGCGGSCGTCPSSQECKSGSCVACVPQCDVNTCGDDTCGGSCGSCSSGDHCVGGQCVCKPECSGKQCGDDGCGGECGTCDNGGECESNGQCGEPKGRNFCDAGCPCYTVVPNDYGYKIADDHGVTFQALQDANPGVDLAHLLVGDMLNLPGSCHQCTPQCSGKTCGDDGCDGSCGSCAVGSTCSSGQCVSTCTPSCVNKDCGDNGCGGSCGSCGSGKGCTAGKCVSTCTPACSGKECGSDGCGGTCGSCSSGSCTDGTCVTGGEPQGNYARAEWWPGCSCGSVNWNTEHKTKSACEAALCKGGAGEDKSTTETTGNSSTNGGVLAIVAVAAFLVVGIVLAVAILVVKRTAPARPKTTTPAYEMS